MPNQYIVDYLKRNKDRFPFEVLKEKLLKAGYPSDQIEEAREIVHEGKEEIVTPPPVIKPKKVISFWDFWHKKTYTSGKEKIQDFIIGFIFIIILRYVLVFLFNILGLYGFSGYILSFVIDLFLIIYFLIKRKYIALGIICEIILASVLRISSLFRYYF